MRAALISNPIASAVTDASRRVVERALEGTFDLELVATESRGHASRLAREAVDAGAKTIVVYGGDGTVNEVLNGLCDAGSDAVLGILPGGGTNVLARSLGYPNDLVEATAHLIDLVEGGKTRTIQLAHLHAEREAGPPVDGRFAFGCGLVLDAETVRRVEASGLRPRWGDLAFVYNGFRAFFAIRGHDRPALVVDTAEGPVDAWWATICNNDPFTYFGSRGMRVAPNASFDRGLDLVAGRTAKTARTLRWLQQTLTSGKHVRHADCLYLEDQTAYTIRTRRPAPLQYDGEYLGEVVRLDVARAEERLTIWA